jgi:hypothetical protein
MPQACKLPEKRRAQRNTSIEGFTTEAPVTLVPCTLQSAKLQTITGNVSPIFGIQLSETSFFVLWHANESVRLNRRRDFTRECQASEKEKEDIPDYSDPA